MRMPRDLRLWLFVSSGLLLVTFFVGLINKSFGLGLLFSLLHADIAIFYWLKKGVSVTTTIAVAVACGNLGVYNAWWIAERSIPVLGKLFGLKPRSVNTKSNYPYILLVFFPIDPYFGVTFGIVFSKILKLRKWLSLALIMVGNSFKMVLICAGINWINKITGSWSTLPYLVLLGTIISMVAFLVYRLRKK